VLSGHESRLKDECETPALVVRHLASHKSKP
jgi:hypothetical protein